MIKKDQVTQETILRWCREHDPKRVLGLRHVPAPGQDEPNAANEPIERVWAVMYLDTMSGAYISEWGTPVKPLAFDPLVVIEHAPTLKELETKLVRRSMITLSNAALIAYLFTCLVYDKPKHGNWYEWVTTCRSRLPRADPGHSALWAMRYENKEPEPSPEAWLRYFFYVLSTDRTP